MIPPLYGRRLRRGEHSIETRDNVVGQLDGVEGEEASLPTPRNAFLPPQRDRLVSGSREISTSATPVEGSAGGGSDDTPSPIPSGVPVAPTSDTTPSPSGLEMDTSDSAAGSCGGSDEFRITASEAPEIEQCYQAANGTVTGIDGDIYSASGTLVAEQMFVVPFDNGGEVSPSPYNAVLHIECSCAHPTGRTCFSHVTVFPPSCNECIWDLGLGLGDGVVTCSWGTQRFNTLNGVLLGSFTRCFAKSCLAYTATLLLRR